MEDKYNKRWREAQSSERNFWEESFSKSEADFQKMCLSFYPVYLSILKRNRLRTEGSRVIDVGSGAYGFVSVIEAKYKVALDPLMDYFQTKVPAEFYKSHNIIPMKGVGEDIGCINSLFDLVCCINTLDHASNPQRVMSEANRVLCPNGHLLLSCNHYAWPIVLYRRFLELIGAGDTNHPNTYHLSTVHKLIIDNGFKIIDQEIGDVKASKQKIAEVGGEVQVSLGQRMKRAMKQRGLWYVIKQMIAYPGHFILNRLFTTYPDSIFLCKKVKSWT